MKEEEARLEAEIKEMLQKAVAVDEEEDRRYGKDKRGDELPKELAFRESRLRQIREAREALEAEARQAAEQAREEGKPATAVPSDKTQRNFTDPDSHIHCPSAEGWQALRAGLQCSGGGRQCSPGNSGGRGHQ